MSNLMMMAKVKEEREENEKMMWGRVGYKRMTDVSDDFRVMWCDAMNYQPFMRLIHHPN